MLLTIAVLLGACATQPKGLGTSSPKDKLLFSGEEKHLKNAVQLTDGGKNAEAYFSFDGRWLVYQSHNEKNSCDQLYVMRTDGSDKRMISTGRGRVTCGYFLDPGRAEKSRIIYSSTHDFNDNCPAPPSRKHGYVWPIYPSYELYVDHFKGNQLKRLTENEFYDAEATVSPDGKEIVFTSTRDGDLELYIMNSDGDNVRRITTQLGYDGGAFFTHDGKRIIYRAYHPKTKKEKKQYSSNLKKNIYRPTYLELFIIDKDGKNRRKITNLKNASFAPFMFPGDKRVIFSTDIVDPSKHTFNLFGINVNGKFLEQLTFGTGFEAFPMFSPNGKHFVWSSSRHASKRRDINIFFAEWDE